MSVGAQTEALPLSAGTRRLADFLELTKPRVTLMVLVTTFAGYYLGEDRAPGYARLIATLIGTALASGGTLALNQYIERGSDALMERTRRRPLPDGRIMPPEALFFGCILAIAGILLLAFSVNVLSAAVTAVITTTYLLIYTPLKSRSALCGIIGAVPGALPPVIGWAAARGELDLAAWVLFAILFFWQVPHTLAIAYIYREDFGRAGIRFLPIVEPDGLSTGRQIVAHSFALLGVSLMPTLIGIAGSIYFIAALILGTGFLVSGARLAIKPTPASARRLLYMSLIYLPAVLVTMALDRLPL
ncbi:MAG TPA: heme o synthase [Verrucomicrobiae bacterium]|jgi:protoheme IX farnesyltransferase|nr:heme o synthase [Verrucomicrobiae bacterium]